jgi:hypothetical protein
MKSKLIFKVDYFSPNKLLYIIIALRSLDDRGNLRLRRFYHLKNILLSK